MNRPHFWLYIAAVLGVMLILLLIFAAGGPLALYGVPFE
jgi:hypothetical protein